ncbi:MAG: hypothetical protein SWH54_00590 [Thermodesulfobacteriota bacterium]|nr:hypothetical protein [Thermodesulfobacteriota bacterium]
MKTTALVFLRIIIGFSVILFFAGCISSGSHKGRLNRDLHLEKETAVQPTFVKQKPELEPESSLNGSLPTAVKNREGRDSATRKKFSKKSTGRKKKSRQRALKPLSSTHQEKGGSQNEAGETFSEEKTVILPDGKIYEGKIINGKRYGFGRLIYPDGLEYEGDFIDDRQEGYGTYIFPDGRRYVGQFNAGKRNGHGTLTSPDGRVYTGQWKDGMITGYGTLTYADGTVKTGRWLDGIFLGK